MPSFVYSGEFARYDFGRQHPLKPRRLTMTYELLDAYNAFHLSGSNLVDARPAVDDDILLAHDSDYLEAVRRLSAGEKVSDRQRYGFAGPDNPPFEGMYEASLLYTGASVQAAEIVASGADRVAFNISGGLHHAMRGHASGFCVFNDAVVAIRHLQRKFDRVAYIDIDVHHGDGVQAAFYSERNVLTISVHESGQWLFPGTGFTNEIGDGEGIGASVNIPLPPGSGDNELARAWNEAAMPVLEAFNPDVIVAQLGADGHYLDPLAHLGYTTEGWTRTVRAILSLNRPVVALGGGGYDPSVVCRLWALAYGDMLGVELTNIIPQQFADRYMNRQLRDRYGPHLAIPQAREVESETGRVIEEVIDLVHPYWPDISEKRAA